MTEIKKLLETEIYPAIDKASLLAAFEPVDKGAYFLLRCPSCNKREAFIYKDKGLIFCNRRDKCGYKATLWDYVAQDRKLSDNKAIFRELCKLAGKEALIKQKWASRSIQKPIEAEINQEAKNMERGIILEELGAICAAELEKVEDAKDYLKNRGFSLEDAKKVKMGFYFTSTQIKNSLKGKYSLNDKDPLFDTQLERRLILIWRDLSGCPVNLWCADVTGKQQDKKYIFLRNTSGKMTVPYGLNEVKSDTVLAVSGFFDYVRLKVNGIDNVIGLGRDTFSESYISPLKEAGIKTVILNLDQEKAGFDGTKKAVVMLEKAGIRTKVIDPLSLGQGIKDPDDFVEAYNIEAYNRLMDEAEDGKEWGEARGLTVVRPESLREIIAKKKAKDLAREGEFLGYPLNGFPELCKNIDGLQPGYYMIAGDTNTGKTAFLVNLFLDIIESNDDLYGIYFSLDDSRNTILNRMLAVVSGIEINTVQKPALIEKSKKPRLSDAYEFFNELADDRFAIKNMDETRNIDQLEDQIKEGLKEHGKIFVMIDGLYNLDASGSMQGAREENIERANKIKALSTRYDIPVICSGEMRKFAKRGDAQNKKVNREPTIHDLMETGKFAYNSDLVLLLHTETPDSDDITIKLIYAKNKLSWFRASQELIFFRKISKIEERGV